MDKKIEKKKWGKKRIALYSFGGVAVLLAVYFFFSGRESSMTIDSDKATFATVRSGDFQEYVIQTGNVVPGRTFYLDAIEGGNIMQILKESGAEVKKGDPILILENASLRLNVLSQENSLIEQINRARTTRLQLDQNYLSQKQQLAQIDNQLAILAPKFKRDSSLYAKNMISRQEFEQTQADYIYNQQRKEFTEESFKSDSGLRVLQLSQLKSSESNMLENLDGVRKILDNLVVKAPIDGLLSTVQLQEGKNVTQGERLGQVDVMGTNKIRVKVDEIYLSRVNKNCVANVNINGEAYDLKVDYIYPNVKDGSFEVDLVFDTEPEGLRNGQSLRVKLELGEATSQIQIPVGGFYSNTGGNWVYVVDPSTNTARKRNIRLGRKNSNYYEVLEGLSPGEQVIISSYDTYGESEVLNW